MPDPLRVLIVEDNEDHARLACEFLHVSGSFTTDVAADLHSLWTCLAERAYDVMTLDYNLPDGNGLKALQEIAARGYQVPVVMVTGRGDERVAAQAIQCGAVDYVVKTGDYLGTLAAVLQKAARTHELLLEHERSLKKIRYQALLLDNVQDAVVVWDLDGRITFWNPAAEALFGWAAAECLGAAARDCYAQIFPAALELAPAAVWTSERQGHQRSGAEFWVSSNLTALRDADGRALGYMDVCRDITARKRLEAQVLAAQTQLAQTARLAAIGELASGVAHQISNPLTTIIAETQLLARQLPAEAPARESLEAIERGGWRAQEAVQRLLSFSRPATATLEPLGLNETIDQAVQLVGGAIAAVGVRLEITLAEALPPVFGNARQLQDLWVNLLLAARDAAEGVGSLIRVRSSCTEDAVQVEVAHDGRPIPAAQLDTAFEPDFERPAGGRGTGLELSICREIVRQHHGQISVRSASPSETTFTIQLPVRSEKDHHGNL